MNTREAFNQISTAMNAAIIGQEAVVERRLIAFRADGHVLMEGLPGVAKTRSIKTLSKLVESEFRRVQFTPDLLPSDVTGSEIYREQTGSFDFQPGPIFGNLVLADEINRAPAKVQSALLEAMQERQVTIGGATFPLPDPFMVLATQNPIEQEGTYPLPEAQVDRFMMKIRLDYPSREEELEIMDLVSFRDPPALEAVMTTEELGECARQVSRLRVDETIRAYVVDLVRETRSAAPVGPEGSPYIEFGASPRAGLCLVEAARARAFLEGRDHTTPQDVKAMAFPVLGHRIIRSFAAEADAVTADQLIARILETVEVP